jgi:hypothetical protein
MHVGMGMVSCGSGGWWGSGTVTEERAVNVKAAWDREKLLAILRVLEFAEDEDGNGYCPWCSESEERVFTEGVRRRKA